MLRYVRESAAGGFVIGTESGIIHRMKKENPGKMFYPILPEPRCPNMKKISLEKVLHSLQTLETRVELPPELMERARRPIERMLAPQ
ncbi:Quinolinate synthase A [bioreactor metagenome]|uniref:Quinolinate synthase A n=1 Tax=bioreactor metagenome TaxID=1076179 RepID=A0A645F0L3_9ZZZZ